MRRHALSAAALAIALVLAAGSDQDKTADGTPAAEAQAEEIPRVAVDEEFELDGVKYKVRSIHKGPTAGRGRHTRFASPGAKFVTVVYEATNQTKKPIAFLSLGPKASDGLGREFSPSVEAEWAIVRTNGRQTMAQTLQPGVTEPRAAAWEVPDDALPTLEFTWKTGLLGREKRVMSAGFGED